MNDQGLVALVSILVMSYYSIPIKPIDHFPKVISTVSMMLVNPKYIGGGIRVMQVWFERFFRNKSRGGDLEIKNSTSDLKIFRREPVPSQNLTFSHAIQKSDISNSKVPMETLNVRPPIL